MSISDQDHSQKNLPVELLRRDESLTGTLRIPRESRINLSGEYNVDDEDQPIILGRNDLVFSMRKIVEEFNSESNGITDDKINQMSGIISCMRAKARKVSIRWKCLSIFCDIITLILPVLTVVLDTKEYIGTITVFTWITVGVRIFATVFRISDKGVIYNYIAIRYSQIVSKLDSLSIIDHNVRTRRNTFMNLVCEAQDLIATVDSENVSIIGMV